MTAANTFFLWTKTGDPSFKATTKDISGLPSGEYCVKVTNGTCSETTKCFTVGNCPATLIKSLKLIGVCALGYSDGSARIVVENGVAPYQYKWSNGANDDWAIGLGIGTYTVTVTDAKNCVSSTSFVIKDRIGIGAITPTAKNGCGDEKGSITLTVEAQANSLGYQWQGENTGFSATTKNISNLNTDRYRVTVSSGCPRPYISDWVSITNSALDVTVSTYPKNGTVGGSVTIQLAGAAPLSYSFDNKPFVTSTFGTIDNLAGGTYSLVVRNGAGCTKLLPVIIYDCDNLETEKVFEIFPEITAQCPFTVKYDYKGKDMKGFKKQIIPHTVTLRTHKNGIDKVAKITQSACIKLTVEDAFCGKPTGTVLAEKCVVPTCDFETSNTHITCTNKTLTVLTDNSVNDCNPISYEWSHSNANTPSVPFTISPNNAKVSVTVIDANGCAQVKLFDFDPLEGSVVANLCEGEGKACIAFNTTYKSSQLYKFTYQSTTTFSPTICNLAAGKHIITVTDGKQCTYVKVFDVPSAKGKLEVVYDVKPAQTNTSHDGTINFNIISGLANYSYTLSNFKDFTKTESNISGTSHSATGLSAGTYYLMIKDANDCSKTYVIELYYCEFEMPNITKEFTVRPLVEVKDYLCTNSILNASFNFNAQNKNITATVQGAPLINCSFYGTGTLPINRQLSQSNATIVFSNITNGQYHFQATEQNGCNRFYFLEIKDITVSTTIVDINDVFWKPEANIKHINAFCKEGSITLKPYVAGFNKTVTYLWKYPDNTTSNKKDLTNLTASGDYKLTITDPDCGKVTEHIFKLNATPNQELKYTVENICSASGKGCVTFEMSPFAAYAPFVFEWKKGNTAFAKSNSPKICNLEAGVYTFLIWNKDSCVLTKTIEVKSSNFQLQFVYTVTNATDCASSNGNLNVSTLTTTNGTAPITFSWFKGNDIIAAGNPPPPNLQILEVGNYKVVATDANGCSVTKPFAVGVKNDINISFSDITAPCPNGTNGIIKATASPKLTNGAFYTYTWGAPINLTESDVASSRVQGLKSGTYILTVSTNGGKCQKVVNYTLQAKTFTSADIKATIKNACKGKSNGSISLTTESTGTAFTWASPPINASMSHQATQLSLPAANNYQVSVTNACGQTAVAIFEVKEVGSFSLTTVTDTKCRTEVKGNFVNAQAPIKYKWANGLVTNSLADNPSSSSAVSYSVTATDANSCTGAGVVG